MKVKTRYGFDVDMNKVRGSRPDAAVADSRDAGTHGKVSTVTPYRSKWEQAYAKQLEAEKMAGDIFGFWYEPFSLWLPGKVRYKPDFMIWHPPVRGSGTVTGRWIELVEVKGWSKNRRDSITRLKIAAALFPCFTWRLVWKDGHGFEGQYISAQ